MKKGMYETFIFKACTLIINWIMYHLSIRGCTGLTLVILQAF
jgi:hypothetical protein